jgi:putative acetyltransferase
VDEVGIRPVDPTAPEVGGLLAALDAYQATLYPAASLHLLPAGAMTGPGDTFLGAFLGGALVGCCGLVVRPEGYGELKRLFVRPDVRGRGIAGRLLADLERSARAAGLTLLRLETGVSQPDSQRVCERAGFTRCGRFGDYPDDPLSVFMEKWLGVGGDGSACGG